MKYDIFGIGNPLVDLLFKVDDNVILELDLTKGSMHLINDEKVKSILQKLSSEKFHRSPGDSTANTLAGVANLGGTCCFCGKVGNDSDGLYYEETLTKDGVQNNLSKCSLMTGKVIGLITPDKERTFCVYLGAAAHLEKEDIFEHEIAQSSFLHLTGYQLEDKKLKSTALHAMDIAKRHNVKISIDLADPNLILRNQNDLIRIAKKYANVIFVNEKEAEALTGKKPEDAIDEIAGFCEIAVVKLGEKGSLIKSGDKFYRIAGVAINAVDTTGAGDMYAAGILFGLTHGYTLDKAGRLASNAAAEVVKQMGARLSYKFNFPEL